MANMFKEREKELKEKGVKLPEHSLVSAGKNESQGTKGRPKVERETKKRVSLAVLPSVYEDVQKICYVKRKSVSEVITDMMNDFVEQNQEILKEYNEIKE